MTEIARAAILGGGVIGAGWLARLIENGIEVRVYDPDPEAGRRMGAVLENADRAYAKLTLAPRPAKGGWRLVGSVAEAVEGAELIVEAVPERIELKHRVYRELEAANADGIVASSTSGYKPTDLQAPMRHPGRLVVAHPFNPVYLLPLVEIVAGERTDPAVVERAMAHAGRRRWGPSAPSAGRSHSGCSRRSPPSCRCRRGQATAPRARPPRGTGRR